jgi:general secretion pathway protein J
MCKYPSKHNTYQSGFTLVELLVALAVMAIMAALSWRGLDVMLRSREITQARVDQIASLENVFRQWDADLNAVFPVTALGAAPSLGNSTGATGSAGTAGSGGAGGSGGSSTSASQAFTAPSAYAANPNSSATNQVMAVDWDGRVLRLVRRSSTTSPQGADGGLTVVGWTLRNNTWIRWQSPDLVRTTDLMSAWSQVSLWAQNPSSESKQYETPLFNTGGWQIYYFRDNAWSNPLSSSGNASGVNTSNPSTSVSNVPDGIRIEVQLPTNLGGTIVKDWVRPAFSVNRS